MNSKTTAILLFAIALIFSFSACNKRMKAAEAEPVLSEMDADSIESTDLLTDDSLAETEASGENTTATAAAATTVTAKAAKQTAATTLPKAKKDSGLLDNATAKNGPTVTTLSVTTDTTAPPSAQQVAYNCYKAAFDKTNALSSVDMSFVSDSVASMSGQFVYQDTFSGSYKIAANGNNLNALIQETENYNGATSGKKTESISLYLSNGYLYASAYGEKVKLKADRTSLENDAVVLQSSKALTESDFEYARSSTSNGYTTITMNPSSDSVNDLIGRSWDSSYKNGNNSFTNITEEIVMNPQGTIDSIQLKCNETEPLRNPENGELFTLVMVDSMKVTYNNPGQPVTITPPSDLSSYTES